jgi:hypothetical protein
MNNDTWLIILKENGKFCIKLTTDIEDIQTVLTSGRTIVYLESYIVPIQALAMKFLLDHLSAHSKGTFIRQFRKASIRNMNKIQSYKINHTVSSMDKI